MPLRGPLWALEQAYRLVAVGVTVCRLARRGIKLLNSTKRLTGLEELSNFGSSGADFSGIDFEHDGQRSTDWRNYAKQ